MFRTPEQYIYDSSITWLFYALSFMSSQMTLTADVVIFHKIFATEDIGTVLSRLGPWEVTHAGQ